jgi:hypothetical protein
MSSAIPCIIFELPSSANYRFSAAAHCGMADMRIAQAGASQPVRREVMMI